MNIFEVSLFRELINLSNLMKNKNAVQQDAHRPLFTVQRGLFVQGIPVQVGSLSGGSLSRGVSVRETPLSPWTDRQL